MPRSTYLISYLKRITYLNKRHLFSKHSISQSKLLKINLELTRHINLTKILPFWSLQCMYHCDVISIHKAQESKMRWYWNSVLIKMTSWPYFQTLRRFTITIKNWNIKTIIKLPVYVWVKSKAVSLGSFDKWTTLVFNLVSIHFIHPHIRQTVNLMKSYIK